MRSVPAYGKYLIRSGSEPGDFYSGAHVTLTYVAPDQPPVKFNPPSYSIGGWGYEAVPGFCKQAADPNFPSRCADEAEIVQNLMAYYQQEYPDCSFTNIRIEGSYGEPFVYSKDYYGAGFLDFMTPQDRWLKNDTWCPGWGQSYPDPWQHQLLKFQTYDCPAAYWPIWGYNPAYNTTGNPDYIAIWPYLCTAGKPQARITKVNSVGPLQRPSCPANENPCFPATGDKMRTEHDLEFAGRSFARYYHSLQEVQNTDAVAIAWSHSFLERLRYHSNTNKPYIYAEDGYIYSFTSVSYRLFRGDQNFGDFIRMLDDGTWLLTKADGERRTYSSSGLLQEIFSSTNRSQDVVLSYDRGNLALAVDGTGRSLRFNYESGLVRKISADDGASATYDYDSDRNLTKVTYSDGASRSYRYGESGNAPSTVKHLLTGILDGGARYATFKYDSQGRASASMLHAGSGAVAKTELVYSGAATATVTGPLGRVSTYTLSQGPFPQVTGIADASGTRLMAFDALGRPTSSTDANGATTQREFVQTNDDGLVDRTTSAVGDAQEHSTVVTRNGDNRVTERRVFNSSGTASLSKMAYNGLGLIESECEYDASITSSEAYQCGSQAVAPAGVRQTRYTYCDATGPADCPIEGLLQAIHVPGKQVLFAYYEADDVNCNNPGAACAHRKGDLWKITNGLGQVTETLAYDGAGRPKSVKDPNGVITDYEYHVRGWLTAVKVRGTNNSAETDDRITRIEYWPTGLVKKVTLPMGAATNYTYDAAHRLTQVSDNAGNKIVYTLDNAGNRIKEEVKNSSGTLKATLSRVYNQLGQLATAADASANPTDFSYDANGNTIGSEDALGRTTSYAFDALNRLKESIQDTAGIQAKTGMKYNALDQVTEVTDPKGLKTTYKYNGFGDLTELKSPDTGTTTYTYDEAGNVKTAKDARGKTVTYAYDGLNRVTSIGYASTALNVAYGYDAAGTACASGETFAKGRLSSMSDGAGTTQYCYNRFGDLVRKVQTINGVSLTLRYTYAANGNLTGMVYPDNTVVDYTRDVQGRVTSVGVTRPAASREVVLSQASYHPFGAVASWTYGNGRTMTRPVDLDYRPLAIVDSAADGLQVGFGYDPVGNLTSLNSATNTTPQLTIGYDALGRLTSLSDPNATQPLEAYTYDATGNRTSAKQNGLTKAYTYASTSHRLTNVGGLARSYAADGSTTALNGTAKQFTYDDTGRMQQTKNGSTVVMNYRYNGRGERTRAYLGSANTYTLYDEAGHWLGDYGNNGTVIQQAIWMDDLPVGVVTTAKTHYLQPDHLGTPRAVIDPASNKAIWSWSIRGEAFGATAPNDDPDQDGQAFVFNLRFPGQRYDAASGLNYNYFRDYEPGTGRYVQSDPVGLIAGVSTYSYVRAGPIQAIDPLGLQATSVDACFARYGPACAGGELPPPTPRYAPEALGGGFAAWAWCKMTGCSLPNSQESRGNSDPIKLLPVNPGRDCDGNCNPCPPGARWFVNKPGHGHENGYWHKIVFNQDPQTCMCYPDRPSGGLEGF